MNPNTNLECKADVCKIPHIEIQRGKSLLYYSQPGVESEIFGLEIAYNTLNRGGNCILVASSASPDIMKGRFKESGMNIELFEDRLIFVDAYSQLMGAPSLEKYIVQDPDNIYNFSKELMRSFKESPPSTIVFGSLSTIMDLCGEKETIEAVRIWNMMAKLCGHTLVYYFTAWPYSNEVMNCINKELFNSVVCVDGMTERMALDQYCKDT
ncbi:MAG: hypothetical protein KKA10_00935 [Euryarchaeota archaeon]|nr:hypothetical protein [Euryarchaeota archaeon]